MDTYDYSSMKAFEIEVGRPFYRSDDARVYVRSSIQIYKVSGVLCIPVKVVVTPELLHERIEGYIPYNEDVVYSDSPQIPVVVPPPLEKIELHPVV